MTDLPRAARIVEEGPREGCQFEQEVAMLSLSVFSEIRHARQQRERERREQVAD